MKKEKDTKKLSILVYNKQGASDGTIGTKKEINAWLRRWHDPENLFGTVTEKNGNIVAEKRIGRKTIQW